MTADKIFVGRKAELEQFKKVLEDPQGQAVLVVGHRGMGKTWLVNKMAELADNHPDLKCGCVRYEVTPTDSVDSTMELMIDHAFEAAQIKDGSFSGTAHRLEQWRSLLNVINLGDLTKSLWRDPAKNTRDQFLEKLQLISKRMPENGRAIFIIDPEKYMQKDSDQAWALVVKQLPEKVKLVFAQRPEDVLVESETFGALDNVSRVPEKNLGVLDEEAVNELLACRDQRSPHRVAELKGALAQYKGHPYTVTAALDLIEAGMRPGQLPRDPARIAVSQWKEICRRGKTAILLFEAYAVFSVPMPDGAVEALSGLDAETRRSLLADSYLGGLIREEGDGKRIYHAILSDYIKADIQKDRKKEEMYHNRVAHVWRLDEKRNRMFAMLVHELKVPLVAIRGATELMRQTPGLDRLFDHDYIRDIWSWTDLLVHLIDNAKAFSSADSMKQVRAEGTVCLKEVIGRIIRQMRILYEERGFSYKKIRCKGLDDFPKLWLDRIRFEQVVFNLLANAINYCGEAPESFLIEIDGSVSTEGFLICFRDWGIGIEDGTEDLIFHEFFRGRSSVERKISGSGLGLWIARQIIDAHGGKIRVTNFRQPTEFEIWLPRSLAWAAPHV